MTAVTPTMVVGMSAHVELRSEDDDGALLYDRDRDETTILNTSAASLCHLLDGRRSVAEVVVALAEEFDGMGPEASAEVLAAVEELVTHGTARVITP